MKVTDLANRTGVTQGAIRHYVRIGLLTPAKDQRNNYHVFSHKDEQCLWFICQAKQLGFSLSEIKKIFQKSQENSPCPMVRTLLQQRITANQQKIVALTALQGRMEQAVIQWQSMPDGLPNGESVCNLIESLGKAL